MNSAIDGSDAQFDQQNLHTQEELPPRIAALRSILSGKSVPCSTGTFNVDAEDLIICYGKDDPNDIIR